MNLSKENTDPKKEPVSHSSNVSFTSKKKMYWKTGERSSRFAFLKHWAALSTLISGVIAMIAVTIVFYRENTGTYYKNKFQSPIKAGVISLPIHSGAESGFSGDATALKKEITIYNPHAFGTSSSLTSTSVQTKRKEVLQEEVSVFDQRTIAPTRVDEQNLAEETEVLNQREAFALTQPALAIPSIGPKLPHDYYESSKKFRLMGRFKMGAEIGLGMSSLQVQDARANDSQVITDVAVKPELTKSYGFSVQAEVFRHFSVGTGIYENSYTSQIIPRFIPDTTGGGFNWPPPTGGQEGEEHEEHGEHGEGENVIQFAEGGYDVVTNAGVTHVSHDMDDDLNILSGSKEYFSYYSIPLQVSYSLQLRKFVFELGSAVNYNHIKGAYALFNVLDDNKYATQKSEIAGIKSHYFSQSANLGVQYKLSYRLSIGTSFRYNYALSTMNTATPFHTRVNSWTGMAGVYYNF